MKRLLPLIALCACGGPGSFNGLVAGNGISVKDSIFAFARDGDGKVYGAALVIADQPNICATVKANRNPANSAYLYLGLLHVGAAGATAPDVGEYTVKSSFPLSLGNWAVGNFAKTDGKCNNTLTANASATQSGLVKISSLKAEANGTMSGTYDLTIGEQNDKVSGNFNALYCDWDPLRQLPTSCE